jgi:hypothetical protein
MFAQPISALRRLVERGKANSPPPSTSSAPTVGDTNGVIHIVVSMDAIAVIPADLVDERDFEGLDGNRVPQLEPTARGGPHSWVYRHGWPVWHTKLKKNY